MGHNLPGIKFTIVQGAVIDRDPVYIGIQKKDEVIDLARGDAKKAEFNFPVEVIPGKEYDFRGPFIHGGKGERFLYLSWGELGKGNKFEMFRRAKLFLSDIELKILKAALSNNSRTIEGAIDLTDDKGGPLCGSAVSRKVIWRAS